MFEYESPKKGSLPTMRINSKHIGSIIYQTPTPFSEYLTDAIYPKHESIPTSYFIFGFLMKNKLLIHHVDDL